MIETDVLILGAGSAGLNARRAAVRAGARALMLDPGPWGTTCARVGCMPSKLLIAAADARWHALHAGVFGVHAAPTVDGPAVLARVQRERDRFVGFVLEDSEELERAGTLLRARGHFTGPHTARAGDQEIRFHSAVIATGSTHVIPEPYQGLGDVLITNDEIFELPDLPESVLVVGTGVIGLELGQALHRLGVRTTLLGRRGVVGPLADPVVKAVARRVFEAELDVSFEHRFESIERVEGGALARFDGREAHFQRVLAAAGRRANLHHIGLETTGILGKNGEVPAIDPHTGQLGDSRFFAAGDVTGFRPLLHEASDEGNIAGDCAARWPQHAPHSRRAPLTVVFSDPQIGLVGLHHGQLDPALHAIGEVDYSRQGRARVMAQNQGWVRIYGERSSGRLVGAEMFGPRVEHTAHLLSWAVQAGMTVKQALEMPFYHPVIEEGIRTALRDLSSAITRGAPA